MRTDTAPPIVSPPTTTSLEVAPGDGFKAFFSYWMMNDFLFLNLIENLQPAKGDGEPEAWFVVTSPQWRLQNVHWISQVTGISEDRVPFAVARVCTAVIFVGLALWWAWWSSVRLEALWFLRCCFLTLAWFLATASHAESLVLDVGVTVHSFRPQPRLALAEWTRHGLLPAILPGRPLRSGGRYCSPRLHRWPFLRLRRHLD